MAGDARLRITFNPQHGRQPMELDPWASDRIKDYARLRDQFGLGTLAPDATGLPEGPLFRRSIVFAHRGWELFGRALADGKPTALMTGLMPSGKMHLGHKMLLDQVIAYQRLGSDIFIAVADLEAAATRNIPLDACRDYAVAEYLRHYVALGLEPCQFYYQSERLQVLRLAHQLSHRVNWSKLEALYGFSGTTSLAHANAPLVQAGDILHPQLPEFGGPRPTLVPVGVDQDPHLRLTRDLAAAVRKVRCRQAKDGRIGAFATGDDETAKLLKDAGKLCARIGFKKQELNVDYGALYLDDAGEADVAHIDAALAFVDASHGGFGFMAPSSTYHRLMLGLTGGKMASSEPDSAIFLADSPGNAQRKVKRAQTTGGATVEEHRKTGGRPLECPVFELYAYHLMDDDAKLKEIHDGCADGSWFCGECKTLAGDLLGGFLEGHQSRLVEADTEPFTV
jgi:tryptophanyl-tRNA synthetase|tara:strand:- start:351 stop:1706 length:1356 start_codon:yes stop_codon:yes gene_type:complete